MSQRTYARSVKVLAYDDTVTHRWPPQLSRIHVDRGLAIVAEVKTMIVAGKKTREIIAIKIVSRVSNLRNPLRLKHLKPRNQIISKSSQDSNESRAPMRTITFTPQTIIERGDRGTQRLVA